MGSASPPLAIRAALSRAVLAAAIVAGTVAAYAGAGSFDFIPGDDQVYVTENPMVRQGLTWGGLWWSLTSIEHANWHPLTWLSLMGDVQLFGVNPGAHHLVNVALHALNAGLFFLLLDRLTGAFWRSALVAALFAVHPLHVESVAWVAERKDLLAGLFFFLTTGAYVWRLRRPGARSSLWVTASFALGLMAKPMLVTLPLVLLLLDHWPLGRVRSYGGAREYFGALWPLLREKLPLLALSVISSAITLVAQTRGKAVYSLEVVPLGYRFGNAAVAFMSYVVKALYPARLAALYPYARAGIPPWQVLGACIVLSLLTAFAFRERLRRPHLFVGWLWFLGMLVPVIGLVQVGAQAMADRYTYLPLGGIFIAAAWSLPKTWTRRGPARAAAGCLAIVALGTLTGITRAQARLWHDVIMLYRHTLQVTSDNWLTHHRLGQILGQQGGWDEALAHLRESLRITGDAGQAYSTGLFLQAHGRLTEAVEFLREAVRIEDQHGPAHFVLGLILARIGEYAEAVLHFQAAVAQDPGFVEAYYQLGVAQAQAGDLEGAVRSLSLPAVLTSAFSSQAHYNLGVVLEELGRREEAEAHYRAAQDLR